MWSLSAQGKAEADLLEIFNQRCISSGVDSRDMRKLGQTKYVVFILACNVPAMWGGALMILVHG